MNSRMLNGTPETIFPGSTSQTKRPARIHGRFRMGFCGSRAAEQLERFAGTIGAWQTIYKRFVSWQEAGFWSRYYHDLGATKIAGITSTDVHRLQGEREPQKRGMRFPKQRKTNASDEPRRAQTKIHVSLTHWEIPFTFNFRQGMCHNVAVAEELLRAIPINAQWCWLTRHTAHSTSGIHCYPSGPLLHPPKSNESEPWFCDWWRYKERHLVVFFLS